MYTIISNIDVLCYKVVYNFQRLPCSYCGYLELWNWLLVVSWLFRYLFRYAKSPM